MNISEIFFYNNWGFSCQMLPFQGDINSLNFFIIELKWSVWV